MSTLSKSPRLSVIEGVVTTTSLDIAANFGKRHDDVLKALRALINQLPADHLGNFAETVTERENPSGGNPIQSPAYRLTRDGFTLLAMGFTGKKALEFKLAYIDAFNKMEAELSGRPTPQLPAKTIFNRKCLMWLDERGNAVAKTVPDNACMVDPSDVESISQFVREDVPLKLMPRLLEMMMRRVIGAAAA
ncbi:MAG: Rha family transcriptional regulator [Betaproteobacteria bacterium]|nr:Rha family transcriptional regulator [Betaproteobacteria bacterium]